MGAWLVAVLLAGCGGSALRAVTPPPLPPPAPIEDAVRVPARARYHYLVGRLAQAEGRWAEAEEALQTALLHDPNSPWVWLALAEVAGGAGEPELERSRAREAVQLGPELADTWARHGEVELRNGDVDAGLAALATAVDRGAGDVTWALWCRTLAGRDADAARVAVARWSERDLADPTLLRERGRLRLQTGDLAGATGDLGEALAHAPTDARLLDEFLTAVTGSGLYRQGLTRLESLRRLAPGNTDILLRAWHLAARAGDPVRAEAALLALDAATAGRDPQVKLWLADVRSQLGRHEEALATLERAARGDPPPPDLPYHRARLLRAAGRLGPALRALQVPESGAVRGDALALRVRLLAEVGRVDDARREAEAAAALLPDDYAVGGALVAACAAQGDRGAMLAAVDRMAMLDDEARARTRARHLAGMRDVDGAIAALEATPMADVDSWTLGGALLREAGRSNEAVAWLDRAVDRFPRDAALRAELGVALDAAGSPELALVAMREALKLDATEARAARYWADALDDEAPVDRRRQARAWLVAALERHPADATLLDALAEVELGLDAPLRAVDAWEEAVRYAPGDPALSRKLAAAYRAVGRSELADALEAQSSTDGSGATP